jgi:hypothetical protein
MLGAKEFVGAARATLQAVTGCKIMTKDICARNMVLLN